VIYDKALSIQTAGTITGVFAFIIDARFGAVAVRAKDALGTAAGVRVTEILGQALARASTTALSANGIRAAGRGTARVPGLFDNN